MVLNTSFADAERLKREYGNADSLAASEEQTFPVTVVGKQNPATISEKYLSEIIEARLTQIFERLDKSLKQVNALDLPGGIVVTGGDAALPGVAQLASDIFGRDVKVFIPNEVGLRHPAFTLALALINDAASMTDVDILVSSALNTPVNLPKSGSSQQSEAPVEQPVADSQPQPQQRSEQPAAPTKSKDDSAKPKQSIFKKLFGTFFE